MSNDEMSTEFSLQRKLPQSKVFYLRKILRVAEFLFIRNRSLRAD